MRINKPYTNREYADMAVYCNANDCHIEDKGDYLEAVENSTLPAPTRAEVEAMRRSAYIAEVDPITAHIQRLRDTEQTDEVVAKIDALKMERDVKVTEIKERYPYPVVETVPPESEAADV